MQSQDDLALLLVLQYTTQSYPETATNIWITTRNQKHHLEGNATPAGCKAKCWAPRVEL